MERYREQDINKTIPGMMAQIKMGLDPKGMATFSQ